MTHYRVVDTCSTQHVACFLAITRPYDIPWIIELGASLDE